MSGRLPRKVLHVMNAAGGGAALSTLGLIRSLRSQGVEACVVCDSAGTPEELDALSEATHGQTVVTPLYWWNRKVRAAAWKRPVLEALQLARTRGRLGALAGIAASARRWGAELIHTNTILTPEGGRAAQLLGLGHVWHLRELIGPAQPFQLPLDGAQLGRYLMAHASVVVANSTASGAAVRPYLAQGRFEVVPNGIDLDAFSRIERRPRGTLVVAMVANLTSRTKKHHLFVEAARMAKGAEFRLYGHAPPEGRDGYVDALRASCASAGVRVMGFVTAAELMRDIDILVHPADNESFGRTVVEAMASGLPVVGVAGGGVGETVIDGQTGFLAEPDAPAALASRISRLAADEGLRRRLGSAGRARASQHFSLTACANRVASVYRTALAAPVGSGLTAFSMLSGGA